MENSSITLARASHESIFARFLLIETIFAEIREMATQFMLHVLGFVSWGSRIHRRVTNCYSISSFSRNFYNTTLKFHISQTSLQSSTFGAWIFCFSTLCAVCRSYRLNFTFPQRSSSSIALFFKVQHPQSRFCLNILIILELAEIFVWFLRCPSNVLLESMLVLNCWKYLKKLNEQRRLLVCVPRRQFGGNKPALNSQNKIETWNVLQLFSSMTLQFRLEALKNILQLILCPATS